VILPRKNLQDLRKISKVLMRRVEFVPVDTMDEVIEAAFDSGTSRRAKGRRRAASAAAPVAQAKPRDPRS
jgi:predicted ATP-dependent protease